MPYYHSLSKPALPPTLARRGLEIGLAGLLVSACAAWFWLKPAPAGRLPAAFAAERNCAKVQIEPTAGNLTLVRVLEADMPTGYYLYAVVAETPRPNRAEWQPIRLDPQSAEPRYLAPLRQGRLYLVAVPDEWSGWDAVVIPGEDGGDTKGASFVHGPKPKFLQPDNLPSLPSASWVCATDL